MTGEAVWAVIGVVCIVAGGAAHSCAQRGASEPLEPPRRPD